MAEIKAKIAGYTQVIETEEELIAMVRVGKIVAYDPVYLPRMQRWAHAEEIPELVEALEAFQVEHMQRMEELANRPWWKKIWDKLRGKP